VQIAEKKNVKNGKNNLSRKRSHAINSIFKNNKSYSNKLGRKCSTLQEVLPHSGKIQPSQPPHLLVVIVIVKNIIIMPILKKLLIIRPNNLQWIT